MGKDKCGEQRLVSLPLSRIRVIMKSSPEVSSINQEALVLTAKATVSGRRGDVRAGAGTNRPSGSAHAQPFGCPAGAARPSLFSCACALRIPPPRGLSPAHPRRLSSGLLPPCELTPLPAFLAPCPPRHSLGVDAGLHCACGPRFLSLASRGVMRAGGGGVSKLPGYILSGYLGISSLQASADRQVYAGNNWSQVGFQGQVYNQPHSPPPKTTQIALCFYSFCVLRRVSICFPMLALCRPGLPQTRKRSTCPWCHQALLTWFWPHHSECWV